MRLNMIANKVGMTQVFNEEGKVIPVTILRLLPCKVIKKKTEEKDGYSALVLGYQDIRENRLRKSELGLYKKQNLDPNKILRESRVQKEDLDNFEIGLTNTISFVLIPLLLLIPFSRKRQDYGFKSFDWRLMICLLLLYIPFLLWKEYSFSFLAAYFIAYLFIGFSEEFLFRSLLQTRLESFFNNKLNAIVIASIMFGIIHIPINSKMYGWPLSLAFCIGANAFGGLLNGYVLYRTRSIWLVTILHAWSGTVLAMN